MAILLIDKSRGISSFDVLRKLRRDFVAGHFGHLGRLGHLSQTGHPGQKSPKMGHAGTLDPRATGLLIVATDVDTKRLNDRDLVGLNKEYVADIVFGVRTDSGDLDGAIIEHASDDVLATLAATITESSIREVLEQMKNASNGTGRMILPVSLFSAMKRGGRPLYEYARAGKTVVVPKREMRILEAELLGTDRESINVEGKKLPTAKVRFLVESGTYIRSLAEEVGRRLGSIPAALAELRRTKVGDFKIEDAEKI